MKKSVLIFCLVSALTVQTVFAQQTPSEENPTLPNTEQVETDELPAIPLTPLLPPSSDLTGDGGSVSSDAPMEDGNEQKPDEGIPEDKGNPELIQPEAEEPATETDLPETGEPPVTPELEEPDIFHPAPGDRTINLPVPQMTKPDSVFLGWNTDPDASEGFKVCCLPKENLVIYPIWGTEEPDVPKEDDTEPPAEETPDTKQEGDSSPEVLEKDGTDIPLSQESPETSELPPNAEDEDSRLEQENVL